MSYEEFEALVQRLESEAEADPETYKFRVFLIALLGYGYLGLIIAGLLALIGLQIYWIFSYQVRGLAGGLVPKLLLSLALLTYLILRSLWVKIPRPEGLALNREQAGPLFESVDYFRERLKSPRVQTILLTDDFNAGVVQVPLLGLFGWPRTYLILGLPLMQALSPQEFCGVLAHEFGHLSGTHNRFHRWIYRIRETWGRLMEQLERSRHWGAFIFERFLRWYVPFFNAYAFVLGRTQEYEADREAAELVGKRNLADALIKIELGETFLQTRFWPPVYKQADREAEPPASLFFQMQEALSVRVQVEDSRQWLDQALKVKTGYHDTHPSLADRLAALGEEARLPGPAAETAADHFFGGHLDELTASLNQSWRERVNRVWGDRYRRAQEAANRLSAIEKKSGHESLTLPEQWERATLMEEIHDSQAALPFYREVLAADAEHAGAIFAIGRLKLEDQDQEGVDLIERAMRLDQQYVIPGCELLHGYFTRRDQEPEAQQYLDRARRQAELYQEAQHQRAQIKFNDRFLPHHLNDEILDRLREQLAHHPEIDRAYLVGKSVQLLPEIPLYILGFTIKVPWYRYRSVKANTRLCERLAEDLSVPGDCYVFFVGGENRKLKKSMIKTKGSLIYDKRSHFSRTAEHAEHAKVDRMP
ncbi:MAG TPA: M48 family metalloprotease [Blastocatellia bacterium]|nr:M48 family metalloprotease [Blastocatellia bacterium]